MDFNVALHEHIKELGVTVKYGDIANEESLKHAGLDRAKVIMCTISDDLLRGINNRDLVKILRRVNPSATIISNAIEIRARDELMALGADVVYLPRMEVAKSLMDLYVKVSDGQIGEYIASQQDLLRAHNEQVEVMS